MFLLSPIVSLGLAALSIVLGIIVICIVINAEKHGFIEEICVALVGAMFIVIVPMLIGTIHHHERSSLHNGETAAISRVAKQEVVSVTDDGSDWTFGDV